MKASTLKRLQRRTKEQSPLRAWRNASTTSRDIPVRDPHRDRERSITISFDETSLISDSTTHVRAVPGPEYEILGPIEGFLEREMFLARKRTEYAYARPVMIERLARNERGFEALERRMIDEASVLSRFDHPNVLSLIELAGDDNFVYLALEHGDGSSLAKLNALLRAKHRALPLELASYVMLEMLRGIHHVHTREDEDGVQLGVVLGGLTPGHVLVSKTGQVKLSLLGLETRDVADTEVSVRDDVRTAGAIYAELLSGQRGMTLRELERENVPLELIDVVACAGERLSDAAQMADAIESWLVTRDRPLTPAAIERFFSAKEMPGLRIVRGKSVVISPPAGARPRPPRVLPPPPPPLDRTEPELFSEVIDHRSANIAAPPRQPTGAVPLVSFESQIIEVLELAEPLHKRSSKPTGALQPYAVKGALKPAMTKARLVEMRRKKRAAIAVRVALFVALFALLAAFAAGLISVPMIDLS